MLLIIHIAFTVFFILLGIVFYFGKGSWLIAGYNTSSETEKAKYNEKKLCRGMAKLMFALAGCWLVIASSEVFKHIALLWIGLFLFIGVVIFGVVYMNTGNRYKK